MALQYSGQTGGVFTDNGTIVSKIQDGDGLDTLIRMADEHRPRRERAVGPGEEDEHPLPAVEKPAEVHLRWGTGFQAGHSFAVLHRLDYNVWDAWLHPVPLKGNTVTGEQPVRLTRNGVSYEMALTAVFRAMGDAMPDEFAAVYVTDQPEPGPDPEPPELPAGQLAPAEAWLPMSYARYLIRVSDGGMSLSCSGQTGGPGGRDATILSNIQDGDSLDTLIQIADEHRPGCEWAICSSGEREHPELTVQERAEVHLKWAGDLLDSYDFAKLHRLDGNVWDARLHPVHLEGQTLREEPPVLLTPNGVSYEMALMAVSRAMGDQMPEEFLVVYLYD